MQTIGALLDAATQRLTATSATPRLDAEVLLAAALGKTRSFLHAWPQHQPPPPALTQYAAWLERRSSGEPVAYLLGQREFWSLELAVTPDTLIPRPETELLVELALQRLPPQVALTGADLGTGSGAIALALVTERPLLQMIATDCSAAALAVARRNAQRLQRTRQLEFRLGDWCAALAGERVHLIVANPPYIASAEPGWRQGDLRFEPVTALVSGADGLSALRTIIASAPQHLLTNGWLLLEHGYAQGAAVMELLRERGFIEVSDHQDTAGWWRSSCGRWPG